MKKQVIKKRGKKTKKRISKRAKRQVKRSVRRKGRTSKRTAKRKIRGKKRVRIKKAKKEKILKIGNVYCLLGEGADCNTYVVKDKKNVVIDPGLAPKDRELRKMGLTPSKIHLVINTHCHYDHASTNNRYKKAQVLAHKNALKHLETGDHSMCVSNVYSAEMPACTAEAVPAELDFGKTKFKVLHTPGHTKDGISLYEPKLKVLICGDLVFAYGWVGSTIYPGGDEKELKKSIRKISKLDIKFLLPGHGPLGTKESIKKALEAVR